MTSQANHREQLSGNSKINSINLIGTKLGKNLKE